MPATLRRGIICRSWADVACILQHPSSAPPAGLPPRGTPAFPVLTAPPIAPPSPPSHPSPPAPLFDWTCADLEGRVDAGGGGCRNHTYPHCDNYYKIRRRHGSPVDVDLCVDDPSDLNNPPACVRSGFGALGGQPLPLSCFSPPSAQPPPSVPPSSPPPSTSPSAGHSLRKRGPSRQGGRSPLDPRRPEVVNPTPAVVRFGIEEARLPWVPGKPLGPPTWPDFSSGSRIAYEDKEARPSVSIVLQYFKMAANIQTLSKWKDCKGAELLVNVDSRDAADQAWLEVESGAPRADSVLVSNNIHEVRAYNKLARMAKAPLVLFVQDDAPPPASCEYVTHLQRLFLDDPSLAVVGMNVGTNTPWNYNDMDAGNYRRFTMPSRLWRNTSVKAEYVACADIGPLVVRRDAFLRLGSFDEGFSYPGRGALGFDFELSTRSWMAGGRVALYNGKASGVKFHQLPAYPSGKDGLRSKAPYFDKDRRVHTVAGSAFARFKTSYGIISRHVSDANKLNVMPTSRMRMTGWNGQL